MAKYLFIDVYIMERQDRLFFGMGKLSNGRFETTQSLIVNLSSDVYKLVLECQPGENAVIIGAGIEKKFKGKIRFILSDASRLVSKSKGKFFLLNYGK